MACTERGPQRYDSEFLAMGTRVQLSLLATGPDTAAMLSALVEHSMRREAIDWYPWTQDASGELKQLNTALASGKSREISPALNLLLQRAAAAYRLSEGYFDPAVAPLTQAWGFADLNDARRQPAAPDPSLLEHWRHSRPTMAALRIDGRQVSSPRRDLQLDLGAIAKGHALQLALQQLQQQGCHDAAINMGGQIGVMGANMVRQWPAVAIRDPRAARALATLQLDAGESIATSGDYERYIERQGRRIHHLLDPHTGLPVAHTQAVTVISRDATTADAASTALMAAGPEQWQRIARQMGVREVLRVDASGAIEVTAALYARLQWNPTAAQLRHITQINL
ncbi:MAG: FAD:protein FMN transferase [Steroidobacteraceae bacterium]